MRTKTLQSDLCVKSVSEDGTFSGYGSIFKNTDLHGDRVMPGAFNDSLVKHKQRGTMPSMLWQHDMKNVVGVYTSMDEDDVGLRFDGKLFLQENVPQADTAYTLMKHKAVRGMSIGFNIPKGGEEWNEKDGVWDIKQVDLVELSIVTYPANPEAQIAAVKSAIGSARDFEKFLRDVGLSQSQAKRLMSGGYNELIKRDVDGSDFEAIEAVIKAANRNIDILKGVRYGT